MTDDPRRADPAAWPAHGDWAERLRFALNWAVLAPSGHNTQPWRFRIAGGEDPRVEVLADRSRALPVVDPEDRELAISCGAAAEALAVALRRFGRAAEVAGPAGGADPDRMATVRPGDAIEPTEADRVVFAALTERRTVRSAFADEPPPAALVERLARAAATRGASLTAVADADRRRAIAALVAEGDRRQFADPAFRRELSSWVHSRRAAGRDGLSGASFGMPDVLSGVGALVIRTFDLGKGVAAADETKIAEHSPLLAVLATPGDRPADWVAAGRALMRVLLEATAAGTDAGYLNQPIEVADLRGPLRDAAGVFETPQLLLRLGRVPPDTDRPPPTPRRPVGDVVV